MPEIFRRDNPQRRGEKSRLNGFATSFSPSASVLSTIFRHHKLHTQPESASRSNCFDLAKVTGEKNCGAPCPKGTKFTTLDGVERSLNERDLMICDAEKPMCIAGVFGGLDSE